MNGMDAANEAMDTVPESIISELAKDLPSLALHFWITKKVMDSRDLENANITKENIDQLIEKLLEQDDTSARQIVIEAVDMCLLKKPLNRNMSDKEFIDKTLRGDDNPFISYVCELLKCKGIFKTKK